MAEKKKPTRVKARLPRGFADRTAADLAAQDRMLATIREVYESYGFEPVETPVFEFTDALGKFLPDSDRPNEGVFSLEDDDGQWMSLRYDLTAPLARFVAENAETLPRPYRSFRAGYVFRNEKPGPGRFRQFMQCDADIVGAPNVSADAEMAMMMADTLEALGIPRGQYVVRVNNRKVLDGLMEAIGLDAVEDAERRLTVLRAIDKLDKLGTDGVMQLLGAGRKDESGDFTPGAGLSEDQIRTFSVVLTHRPGQLVPVETKPGIFERLLKTVVGHQDGTTSVRNIDNLHTIESLRGYFAINDKISKGLDELRDIAQQVRLAGYDGDRIRIVTDISTIRGLEYYTGPVFEAELLFPVTNERGETVRFGSVGGGGRYDGLVSRFLPQPMPATGFSIGVSRLQTALKNLGRLEGTRRTGPVVVTVMEPARAAEYGRIAAELRAALNPRGPDGRLLGPAVPVEVFQGNPKGFGKQLQYADRRDAPVAIIQGADELAAGVVQVKDLALGKALSAGIADNAEWREARAGQDLVPYRPGEIDALAAAVRAILGRPAAPDADGAA